MWAGFRHLFASGRARGRGLAGLLLAVSLGGCASVFSAQVSRYEQWPQDASGARYWIEPDTMQQNNLQFQTYSDAVRAALGPTGLVEAASDDQARFIVHMDYSNRRERAWVQQPVDPYFYPGPYGYPGPFYGPWGWGYGPAVASVPVDFQRMALSVRIDDRSQQGREVYRATAKTNSRGGGQLNAVMPYLARAIFDQFPGRNGEVIQVRYPLPR